MLIFRGNVAAINIASACSSYSGSHFISGSHVLGESGFWKLEINSPPFLSKSKFDVGLYINVITFNVVVIQVNNYIP